MDLNTFVCVTLALGYCDRLCSVGIYLLSMITRDQWLCTWSGTDHSLISGETEESVFGF